MKKTLPVTVFTAMLVIGVVSHASAQDSESDLAKATQNPVSDLISLPLQNNFNFGVGPDDDLQYTLNIQPVYPVKLGESWSLINRIIAPLMYLPETTSGGSDWGFGDTIYEGFFSPRDSSVTWGIGPVLSLPTAKNENFGAEEWAAGPAAVLLAMPGAWVVGGTAYNIWSIDGGDVNFFLFQYFINYNFESGAYLTSAPILTSNWDAESGEQWTVPFGLGAGKVLKIGKMPVNTQLSAYYNVEKPTGGAEWQLRLQVQLLFPK